MEIGFFDVLITVFSLVILAVPGFIFAKCKMLPEKASEALSVVVLYGCQCALVFTSFQSDFDSEIAVNMLIVAAIAAAVHLIMIGIMFLLTAKRELTAKLKCLRYASVFSNCGFMGLPFLQSVFAGTDSLGEILIYGAIILAVFNILNWTFGVYIMTGERSSVSVKKIVLNPVIISLLLGFILFITVRVPIVDVAPEGSVTDKILTKLMDSLGFLSNMVTPLSMIVIGIRLANINVKNLFLDKYAYFSSAAKLILMPLVCILGVAFLPVSIEIKYTVFFLLSMPTAASVTLFAVQFGGDGDSASVMALLSTILSIITIPLLYLLFGAVVG